MSTPNTNKIQNNTIRRELGALWNRKGSSGSEYLTGKFRLKDIKANFDEVKIIVFPNNNKKNDGSPDFQIFMEKSQYETLTGTSSEPAPTAALKTASRPAAKDFSKPAAKEVSGDHDLI